MYYKILGTIENEYHTLNATNNLLVAMEYAKFKVDSQDYDCCEVVNEEGKIVYEYKGGN